jgi:hypothetical protein
MKTDHPLAKAVLVELGRVWPQSVRFGELLTRAGARLAASIGPNEVNRDVDAVALCDVLLSAYSVGLVELHVLMPHFVLEVSERPVASPLARLQIQNGAHIVTNLQHSSLKIEDAVGRLLLVLLDGTRDRKALLRELLELVARQGGSIGETERAGQITLEVLEEKLAEVARLALLVA